MNADSFLAEASMRDGHCTRPSGRVRIETFEFVVLGEPAAWCVYTRRGPPSPGFEAMQVWQALIQAAVINKYGRPLLDCPVELEVRFFRTLPGPTPQTKKTWLRRCWKQVGKRPDRSNFLKAFEDALTGVLIKDDSLIVTGITTKWFAGLGESARTWCKVTPLRWTSSGTPQ